MAVEVFAPAKVNLTLEVLGRRSDGYHEVATMMQTIDLCDRILLEPAATLELEVTGGAVAGVPMEGPANLALGAALALRQEAGNMDLGARILLEKRIPTSLGLGGGSSDAAAVLRGLDKLWALTLGDAALARLAARLGSDVPFFLYGGTAECRGRGEVVQPLPDHVECPITIFTCAFPARDKTRRMYGLLDAGDFSDGGNTLAAAAQVRRGLPVSSGELVNAFDRYVVYAAPRAAEAMQVCRRAGLNVHATGSGPGFFALVARERVPEAVVSKLDELGISLVGARTLCRGASLAVREV